MESLGLLNELNPFDCFTFNGKYTYTVIGKNDDNVRYKRINRGQKTSPKIGIEWNERHYNYNPLNPFVKEYSINGNIEVFDFLPF